MNESFEKFETPETILSEKEVYDFLKNILEDAEYATVRKEVNETGLYLLEVKVSTNDGGCAEYVYTRKGRHEKAQADETAIDVVFYDEAGFFITGDPVAKHINDQWKLED